MSYRVPVRAVTALLAAFYYKSQGGMDDQIHKIKGQTELWDERQNRQHAQIWNKKQ